MCKHFGMCTSCHICVYTVHAGRTRSHSKYRDTAFERALKMYIELCSIQTCVHNAPTNRTRCAFMCCVDSCECRHSRTHSTLDTLNMSSLHMTHSTGHLHNNSTFTNSTSHLHITNSISHLSESLSHMQSTARSRKNETRHIDETRNGHRNAKHIDCI